MAVLRGAEAQAWLAANPGKAYKDLTTGQSVQAQPSALMKILQGITKPFRMGAGVASDFGSTIGQLARMAKGDTSTQELSPLFWLTEEENRQLREDPLKAGLKAGVGVAAYGMPVGGGSAATTLGRVGTAAGRGAIGGGMSGFALSEDEKELQGALTGSALGGILGGGLQAGKEALGAVAKARTPKQFKEIGESIETPVGRPSATKGGINTYAKSQEISKNMEKTLKENIDLIKDTNPQLWGRYKSGLISQTEKTQALEEVANAAVERAGFMRDASKAKIDVTDIQRKILNSEWMQKNPTAKKELMKAGFFEDISQLGQAAPASGGKLARYTSKGELFEFLKNNVDEGINYARNPSAPQPKLEQAYKQVQRIIRNEIERGASPEYIKYNQIYRTFADARSSGHLARISNDELARTFGQTGSAVKLPIVSDVLESQPVKMGMGRLRNLAGRSLQGEGLQNVAQGAQAGAGGLASLLGVAQRGIPATPAIMGSQGVGPEETDLQGDFSMPYGAPQLDRMALVQAVLNGDISTTEAKFIVDMLGGGGGTQGKLTKDQANAQAALQSLDTMESILSSNPSALAMTYLPFQGFNEEAQILEQAALNIEDVIARMRTGAVINDEEARRYRKMIPRITDTPQTKIQKINQLRNIFRSVLNRQGDTQGSALLQLMQGL